MEVLQMRKSLLLVALLLVVTVLFAVPATAEAEQFIDDANVYVVESDTDIVGLDVGVPIPPPKPPEPEPPTPKPKPEPVPAPRPEEDHTPPGTTPRPEEPRPEPTPPAWEPEPPIVGVPRPEDPEPPVITIAVERVLPCPPEPVMPGDNVPEPTLPPWEPETPEEEVFTAALPPWEDSTRGCVVYCTLDVEAIIISVDSFEDIDPKLFVFDMISCRAEVVEPTVRRHFEVERPRGTRLFIAVFDSEGVIFDITVWTPPAPEP
ncbi:hypothetical protein IKT18_01125 [Candidatus Saccharibacteria bacterium]|nr:hypothetical protein [Candidatus Saccharibacteria bacterium]